MSFQAASSEPSAADQLRYPIGKFKAPDRISLADLAGWLDELQALPDNLSNSVTGLKDVQLDTPYRPGGWTVRQVIHHVPDSHLNSYQRFRLALTEDSPTIRPYSEERWAELADAKSAPIEISLALVTALHQRWALLLRSMTDADFARTMIHPALGTLKLDWTLGLYAWHGRHHVAHILSLRDRMKW